MTPSQRAKALEALEFFSKQHDENGDRSCCSVDQGTAHSPECVAMKAVSIMNAEAGAPDSEEVAIDQAPYSEQLTNAKRLIVDVWQRYPSTRKLIEGRTGRWFLWGDNRDATPEGNRQYYFRNPACKADSETDPDCLCWHDEGTGPGLQKPEMIRTWRAAHRIVTREHSNAS